MDVGVLAGVGPRKLEGLRHLGITSLLDLLTHYPRRYIDRTREAQIRELSEGEEALVLGRVAAVSSRRVRGGRVIVVAELRDDSGSLRCTFFNQPWREKHLAKLSADDAGAEVAVFGRVEVFRGQRQMTNPVLDVIGAGPRARTGRIVAIYPQSDRARLSTWELGEWIAQVLRRSRDRGIDDPVPAEILDRHDLISREEAYAGIHAPTSMAPEYGDNLLHSALLKLVLRTAYEHRSARFRYDGSHHETFEGYFRSGAHYDRHLEALTEVARQAAAALVPPTWPLHAR